MDQVIKARPGERIEQFYRDTGCTIVLERNNEQKVDPRVATVEELPATP